MSEPWDPNTPPLYRPPTSKWAWLWMIPMILAMIAPMFWMMWSR